MALVDEFLKFKEIDESGFLSETSEKEILELLLAVILGRNWISIDSSGRSDVLVEQFLNCLRKLETFDVKEKLFNNLSEDKKNLYDAILSFHLDFKWRIKFVDKEEMDKLYNFMIDNLNHEYIVIKHKNIISEKEEVLIFYMQNGKYVYILDSDKVHGSHIKDFIEEFKDKEKISEIN